MSQIREYNFGYHNHGFELCRWKEASFWSEPLVNNTWHGFAWLELNSRLGSQSRSVILLFQPASWKISAGMGYDTRQTKFLQKLEWRY